MYPPLPNFDAAGFLKTAGPVAAKLPAFLKWLLKTKGRSPILRRGARWVGRQIHSTTGMLPGLESLAKARQTEVLTKLRAGLPGAQRGLIDAQKALASAKAKKGMTAEIPSLTKAVGRAKAGLQWTKLTGGGTVPGTIRAMGKHPLRTMRLGWQGMDPWSKGLFLGMGGLGAYEYANPLPDEYGPGGVYENPGEHLGSEIGGNIGFLATGAMPFLPMMGTAYLADKAFSLPGRLLGQG